MGLFDDNNDLFDGLAEGDTKHIGVITGTSYAPVDDDDGTLSCITLLWCTDPSIISYYSSQTYVERFKCTRISCSPGWSPTEWLRPSLASASADEAVVTLLVGPLGADGARVDGDGKSTRVQAIDGIAIDSRSGDLIIMDDGTLRQLNSDSASMPRHTTTLATTGGNDNGDDDASPPLYASGRHDPDLDDITCRTVAGLDGSSSHPVDGTGAAASILTFYGSDTIAIINNHNDDDNDGDRVVYWCEEDMFLRRCTLPRDGGLPLTGSVTTIAGNSHRWRWQSAIMDGIGSKASFNIIQSSALCIDPSRGSAYAHLIYFIDQAHCIRVLDTRNNSVTTVAGGTCRGLKDGIGKEARFARPTDIIMDPYESGHIYVVDADNRAIRRLVHDDRRMIAALHQSALTHAPYDLLSLIGDYVGDMEMSVVTVARWGHSMVHGEKDSAVPNVDAHMWHLAQQHHYRYFLRFASPQLRRRRAMMANESSKTVIVSTSSSSSESGSSLSSSLLPSSWIACHQPWEMVIYHLHTGALGCWIPPFPTNTPPLFTIDPSDDSTTTTISISGSSGAATSSSSSSTTATSSTAMNRIATWISGRDRSLGEDITVGIGMTARLGGTNLCMNTIGDTMYVGSEAAIMRVTLPPMEVTYDGWQRTVVADSSAKL